MLVASLNICRLWMVTSNFPFAENLGFYFYLWKVTLATVCQRLFWEYWTLMILWIATHFLFIQKKMSSWVQWSQTVCNLALFLPCRLSELTRPILLTPGPALLDKVQVSHPFPTESQEWIPKSSGVLVFWTSVPESWHQQDVVCGCLPSNGSWCSSGVALLSAFNYRNAATMLIFGIVFVSLFLALLGCSWQTKEM